MGDPSLLKDTRQLPSQSYPRTYTCQSVSNLPLLQLALTPPGCRAQTAIMPLMTPLPSALRQTQTSLIHTQGNGLACIRSLLPSHYHPLPSLIGPATAAPTQHSRTCPPLPSPTLSLLIPLARPPPLPSYAPAPTTTGIAVWYDNTPITVANINIPTTTSRATATATLAVGATEYCGNVNPRTRPRREVRLLLLRRVSTASLER